MKYKEFLSKKHYTYVPSGFDAVPDNEYLFDYESAMVTWALKKGKSALFADTGLGKTICQLVFANEVCKHTGGNVLILAPLAVASQTVDEGRKFGIDVHLCRKQEDVKSGINITNYEMIHHFDIRGFCGVVLDESSILKSFSGKTTRELIEIFRNTPYKLACTATPAPNDYEELGNHAEFLGVMNRTEMLATFFVHDGGDTSKWRLKGHAEEEFWRWVASWAMVVKCPGDIGFENGNHELPELNIKKIFVESQHDDLSMIAVPAQKLEERRKARKESLDAKVQKVRDIIGNSDQQWLIWCDFNDESQAISRAITDVVEVKGSDTMEHKESSLVGFANGKIKRLVTKPKIAGFGMNWQSCNNMIFCGLSDSYERFYQSVRRCWRFGQKNQVNVYIVISEKEEMVLENIKRKGQAATVMAQNMTRITADILKTEIMNTSRQTEEYFPDKEMILPKWEEFRSAS